MAASTPQFDARMFTQVFTLLDSPVDGEAQSALMQLRRIAGKAGFRIVDLIETQAYHDAINRKVKPVCERPALVDNREVDRLKAELAAVNDRLADEQALHDYELQRQQKRIETLETASARLRDKLRDGGGGSSFKVKAIIIACLCIGLIGVGVKRVFFSSSPAAATARINDKAGHIPPTPAPAVSPPKTKKGK